MRVSKFEPGAIPVPARERVSRAYGLGHGDDAVWPPKGRAYGGPEDTPYTRALAHARVAGRLAVPVVLLFTLMLALYLYADAAVPAGWLPAFAEGQLLIISDLVLPGCWMVIHLTNRRFGPAYAFGQLAAALALCLLTAAINPFAGMMPDLASLTWRAIGAFFLVFAIANFAGIVFFDAARGPRWWTAPLVGSLAASFVFSGLYYPLAFGRLGFEGLMHFALFAGVSLALMLPYYLLRPAMKPVSGMNGY
jgi:hypothetical protein